MASNVQSKLLLEAAQRYAQEITPEALIALDERGISEQVAARFQLGSVVDPINGHEMHENWISIPYITAGHTCVGFKFRRLDDGKPKYGSPTGQKAHLYNVSDVLPLSPHIVICEGELDTVVTSGMLGIPAVGVPGVQAWKPHFHKLFSGYETVFVVGDNDVKEDGTNPGAEFAKRVANEILNSVIVTLPPGMDINDYYLAYGADKTKELLVGNAGNYKAREKERKRKYWLANRERLLAYGKAYSKANPKVTRRKQKKYWAKHPEKALAFNRKRRARVNGVEHIPYTKEEVLEKYGSDCHICGTPIDLNAPRKAGKKGWEHGLHLDHLIPISKGGPDTIDNVRPAHGICNMRKGARGE